MPSFSIIIPVYNKEKYLSKTLESVLQQSFTDFEVLIIDDGSIDGSEHIIKGYIDSRIHYIKQKNKGVSEARNAGIQSATAQYIALLDADDTWHPNYLESMYTLIKEYPEESVFACACSIETKSKTLLPTYSNLALEDGKSAVVDYFSSSYINTILTSSSTIINRAIFNTIGIYNPTIKSGEDTDLWIRIGIAHKVVFLNKVLATYTYEPSSLSNSPKEIKNTLQLDGYEEYTTTHKGLKKFLDLNRYSLAIITKRTNASKEEIKKYRVNIDPSSLNKKQLFLLNTPNFMVKILFQVKGILEKIGFQLSTYK
ncbi:MAG: glycosyltransferase involved in cell wall biosynthesis [Saprospiraceae bacterium]|jgi:glycosyltransferase involved in cell wall biosynthesis